MLLIFRNRLDMEDSEYHGRYAWDKDNTSLMKRYSYVKYTNFQD